MSRDTSKEIRIGSLLSYLQMGLNILIGLFYTPVMIRLLGTSEYGLYQTVTSTISMLSVLNLGFNAGYVRYFAKYKNSQEQKKIYKLNGLFLIIFCIIGVIAFSCGTFLNFNLELVFKNGLNEHEYETVHVLMQLLTFNLAISFPMSVFQNIISANERFIALKIIGMIKTVIGPFVTLPILLMGFRSIGLVTVTVALSIIADIIYVYYVIFVLQERFIFNGFEPGIIKGLFAYTAFIALNSIIDQINLNIDKVLLARFRGTTQVSIYSVGYAMYSYYQMLSTSVSGVFIPRVHRLVDATKETQDLQKKQLTSLFVKVGRIQYMILGLVATGFILFGKPFIVGYWANQSYTDSYYVALLLMIPAIIPLTQNLGIEIQRAQNRHQFRSVVYSFMAICNLALSIYLCQIYGAIGSAIGTAISLVIANGIIINIFYHIKCNVDIICYWKNIFSLSIVMIIPIFYGIIIGRLFNLFRLGTFLFAIFSYSLLYAYSLWFFGMNEFEKDIIQKFVAKGRIIFKR